ncbi:hypothetical protein A3850_003485 [Lewinella sp. 4G2]|nr:hypothetical protein A3850_003485 [Lewinella sp. 4G2]
MLGTCVSAQESSEIVYLDAENHLRYVADDENNYVADFSHAGYKNGDAPLPEVPTVLTLDPITGDNTAHIQAALDDLAARTPDANGYRGALLLGPGNYPVSGQLFIRASGMVLRGSGQEINSGENTVIQGLGNAPTLRNLIVVQGQSLPSWTNAVAGTRSDVTSEFVPAGSRTLEVAAAEFYRRGDRVIVTQPSTAEWLASIDRGATAGDEPWATGDIDLYYNRLITDVNIPEGKITLNIPVYDHLDRSLAQSSVYILDDRTILTEVGIENLRIDVQTNGPLEEDHVRTTIFMRGVQDAWVKDVTALNFSYALVDLSVANRVTVTGCSGLAPHSPVLGGRRYNFCASSFTNNCLFTDNYATEGRHAFVSNGTSSVSGIVFHNSISDRDLNVSEGHRRWSQGLLFDQLDFRESNTRNLIGLYNRGDFGTGHGWASVNSVAWNVQTPSTRGIIIQKPPGRQNYAIGCRSNVTGTGPFDHPAGYIELTNETLAIPSLYDAQLANRREFGITPDAPAKLERLFFGDGLTLTWMDIATRETGYVVVASNDGGVTYQTIATLPPNTEAYGGPLPTGSGTFIYRVYALNDAGPSPFSNGIAVQGTTSVREATARELRTYPNPVTNQLMLETERPLTSLEVHDANGRAILTGSTATAIDTSAWPAGLYVLKVHLTDGRVLSRRIIKQ